MKNVVKLQHYYFPWELEASLRDFVAYYDNERYHEALDNVTPADAYCGRKYAVVSEREKIKKRTLRKRKKEYLAAKAAGEATPRALPVQILDYASGFLMAFAGQVCGTKAKRLERSS